MALSLDWGTLYITLRPLALFIIGMVIYGIFIYKFYRFLAKRDIFEHDMAQYNTLYHDFWSKILNAILNFIKYVLIYPAITFFWFAILSVLIIILSKEQPIETTLLMAMALVGAVRITSYYSEDLARDMAKTLPWVLLGIFLTDISFFSIKGSMDLLILAPNHWVTTVYYFGFIVVLELFLVIWEAIKGPSKLNQVVVEDLEE